jgi:NADH:ubiquinone oxidoreductase subunit 6 (subunit J)
MFLKLIFFSFVISCAYQLLKAKNIIKALFSFFGILISFIFSFFYIQSDYVGSIIMLVYFGAIIIFFAFALMTIDPRYFEISQAQKIIIHGSSFRNVSFFFTTFFYFYLHYKPINEINYSNTINFFDSIKAKNNFFFFETSSVKTIGQSIYTFYLYPLNFLGIILLISLITSLSVLSFRIIEKKIY